MERKALVDILRKAGSENAVSILEGLLHQRIWFRSGESNEVKVYVVKALASIATETASKALWKGAKMRNKKIRKACEAALQIVGEMNIEGKKGEKL